MSESRKRKVGDSVEVKIERIVPRGFGIGFAEGLAIFVALAAPGDLVRARLTQIKKKVAFAEIIEILEPSSYRVEPRCPHFGVCGGCDFQQLSYQGQLDAKLAIIRDSLRRIGGIEYTGEMTIIPSPDEYGYRSRARWHAARDDERIGYYARDSHTIVDVSVCPILTSPMEATLFSLKENLPWASVRADATEIEATEGDGGDISVFSHDVSAPLEEVFTTVREVEYAYSARTFFQANRNMIPQLIDCAIDDFSGASALDLYCGVGLFSIPLSRKFDEVTGVEANTDSIRFAKQNRARADASNLLFIRKDVDVFLENYQSAAPDLVVFDPPRSGAEIESVRHLNRIRAKYISYVSCDPAILARDLSILTNYSVERITAVDLFPQSHHVETVVRLNLR